MVEGDYPYYDAGYAEYPQYVDEDGNPIDYYADYGELTDEELAALLEAGEFDDEDFEGEEGADYDGYSYYDFFPAY